MRQTFGLIGRDLSHSFSRAYFENKFRELNLLEHSYLNFEIVDISELKKIINEHPALKGLNVTHPYKESVLPYLDDLSEEAAAIGAVNCIRIDNGKMTGFNTDMYGFSQSIKPFLDVNHSNGLILGTGGASKAIAYVLKKKGVDYFFVTSSSGKKNSETISYDEINELVFKRFKLIVNTTPVGMYPRIDEAPPLPYEYFSEQHLAYDLIYNPPETRFLKNAREQGSIIVNGLSMLQLQADKSWEIWNKK
jgi:shikimate dehydrogenase